MSHKSNERREYKEYLGAYGEINDVYYENSPLSQIIIGVNPMNARSLKVMNNEFMVISKGVKYYLPARNDSKSTVGEETRGPTGCRCWRYIQCERCSALTI